MSPRLSALALALLSTSVLPLPAQEDAEGQAGSPLTPHHAVLKEMAGAWSWEAVEKASDEAPEVRYAGSQVTSLLGDGLFAVSQVWGTYREQPFEGLHVLGYSPLRGAYRGAFLSNMAPFPALQTATWDAETNTFDVQVEMPTGGDEPFRYRMTIARRDADTWIERLWFPGPDGAERVHTELTIRRLPKDAKAPAPKSAPGNTPAELAGFTGNWDCALEMSMGQTPMTWSGKDVTRPMCGGHWVRTTFTATFLGRPFEGLGLVGFDPASKRLTTFWLDSWTAEIAMSTGAFDEARKVATLEGATVGSDGEPATTREIYGFPGPDRRTMEMTTREASGAVLTMKIAYTRTK